MELNTLPSEPGTGLTGTRWGRLRVALRGSVGRFPELTLCCLVAAVAFWVALEKDELPIGQLAFRAGRTAVLGIPLLFSISMLLERVGFVAGRVAVRFSALLFLLAHFWALPGKFLETPVSVHYRWGIFLAGLHFGAAVSAHWGRAGANGFWQFNRRLFSRFFLAALYSGVLTVGLELALVSANLLFELRLQTAFLHLLVLMAFVFHPLFFLAGVPADLPGLEGDTGYPGGLKAFTQFALAPIVAVFTVILYAYAARILVTLSWPRGWVAMPVLLLSGVGILAHLLLHPLRQRPEERWAAWFCRNFPRALGPLALLLLLSVRERIGAYGVTEERHLGLVAGGWILLWALGFALRPGTDLRWVPASLALLCLVSGCGPLSAASVSLRSQKKRIFTVLERNGLLQDGRFRVLGESVRIPDRDYGNLRSILAYLGGNHGPETIRPLLDPESLDIGLRDLEPGSWDAGYKAGKAAETLLAKLHIATLGDGPPSRTAFCQFILSRAAQVSLAGFSRQTFLKIPDSTPAEDGVLHAQFTGGVLEITLPGKPPEKIPLGDLFKNLPEERASEEYRPVPLPPELLTVDWHREGRPCRILFTELSIHRQASGEVMVGSGALLLMEK